MAYEFVGCFFEPCYGEWDVFCEFVCFEVDVAWLLGV